MLWFWDNLLAALYSPMVSTCKAECFVLGGTVRFISRTCTEHQALDTDSDRTHILEQFTDQAVCL